MLTDHDIYLFREGSHSQLHSKLGCRVLEPGAGAHFAVWAPNAEAVSVIGDWNGWTAGENPLIPGRTDPESGKVPRQERSAAKGISIALARASADTSSRKRIHTAYFASCLRLPRRAYGLWSTSGRIPNG